MSQTLNVQVNQTTYAALEQQAAATGKSPAQLAAETIEKECRAWKLGSAPMPPQGDLERQAARARFERQFGSVDLGYPTGADNESIDADLAKEYSASHEGA